jgi:hypothetical protein
MGFEMRGYEAELSRDQTSRNDELCSKGPKRKEQAFKETVGETQLDISTILYISCQWRLRYYTVFCCSILKMYAAALSMETSSALGLIFSSSGADETVISTFERSRTLPSITRIG